MTTVSPECLVYVGKHSSDLLRDELDVILFLTFVFLYKTSGFDVDCFVPSHI